MKRRKTISKYDVDNMGRIKKKEISLSPTTETMLALSMLTETMNGLSNINPIEEMNDTEEGDNGGE